MRIPAGELIPDVGASAGGGILLLILFLMMVADSNSKKQEGYEEIPIEQQETLVARFPQMTSPSEASEGSIAKLLVGEWQDGSGTTTFSDNGTVTCQYPNGNVVWQGDWKVSGQNFYIRVWATGYVSEWSILSSKKNRIVVKPNNLSIRKIILNRVGFWYNGWF